MKKSLAAVGLLAAVLTAVPLAPASAEGWHHGGGGGHRDRGGDWGHHGHGGDGLAIGLIGAAAALVAAPFILADSVVSPHEPVYAEASYPQPVYAQQPVYEQPVYAQPVYAAPAYYPVYHRPHPHRVVVYGGYPAYGYYQGY